MMIGVVIAAAFPKVLNRAPFIPAISLGEVSATTAQPRAPIPLPKKASDMQAMTSQSDSMKLHVTMTVDSSIPATMGDLRDTEREQPRLSNISDNTPPNTPPARPHRAGKVAANPADRIDIPRCLIR